MVEMSGISLTPPGHIVPEMRWNLLRTPLIVVVWAILLSGCEMLGLEGSEAKQADAKAVGGGCRQSGRAIEDCYAIYSWLPRAFIYEGWRDMDLYMRENNLETVVPQLPPVQPPPPPPPPPPKPPKKAAAKKAPKTQASDD
jgi:hypothetical protein